MSGNRIVSFEELAEVCKYKSDNECSEENNYDCVCDCDECPLWSEWKVSEVEL